MAQHQEVCNLNKKTGSFSSVYVYINVKYWYRVVKLKKLSISKFSFDIFLNIRTILSVYIVTYRLGPVVFLTFRINNKKDRCQN